MFRLSSTYKVDSVETIVSTVDSTKNFSTELECFDLSKHKSTESKHRFRLSTRPLFRLCATYLSTELDLCFD